MGTPGRLPIFVITATVTLDAMGVGLIMPVMPALLREVDGGSLAQAAAWGGIMSAAFAVMQFLFGPVVGALSDRWGRRPVLLISLLAMAADYVIMALAGSLWLLLVGRILGGITAATHSTANAYMADISAPHEKAQRFGLLMAGFGVGFVLGPILGGFLAEYGTRAPFWAAGALALANALLGFAVLGESLPRRRRRRFSWARANPFGAFRAVARLAGVAPLLAVFFLFNVATYVYPAVWAFFLTERFGWGEGTIGLSLGIYGLSYALTMAFLVQPTMARLGPRGTVIFGLAMECVTLVLIASLTDGRVLLAMIPIAALGSLAMPALQAAMSDSVAPTAQGELQGLLTSVSALAMATAPVLMTQVFAYFTAAGAPLYLPGAPFFLAAALMVLCLALFLGQRSGALGR
ncbi:MAG: MFS transporter [Rhodobacteraceae bacterium]|jgi:DHA1 family tetracycline resistance protein-like MFS transporter|nr:MFS transporter [Paracoccaceae bacterium]